MCCRDNNPECGGHTFLRLARIHRSKGHQGLNMSPPSAQSDLLNNLPPSTSSNNVVFYAPKNGASNAFSDVFMSSFLPKYQQFLSKHKIRDNQSDGALGDSNELDESPVPPRIEESPLEEEEE